MAEPGGPTTQAGIFYQNTIAALYLGRMLDLRERPAGERVTSVRVEAPDHVDDVVVRMGDGSQRFIQVKLTIQSGTPPWDAVWRSFAAELHAPEFGPEDRLRLVLGTPSTLAEDLRACCERTNSSVDNEAYVRRLSARQQEVFNSIVQVLSEQTGDTAELCRRILSRTDVEVIPHFSVERDYAPLWIPIASEPVDALIGRLRDLVGGGARVRERFDAMTLRARLADHGITIDEPADWGAEIYREIVKGRAIIEIPGTGVARPISDNFVWPRATRYEKTGRSDFDDDTAVFGLTQRAEDVDVSMFPIEGFNRVVVVAGPGFGKSVLTKALAARIASAGQLPVVVPIPELSRLDKTIADYLIENVNVEHEVRIDWQRAAESGILVLLLDGLDEISSPRRTVILDRLKTFSLRYPSTSWLLTVRDAAALPVSTEATMVEMVALDDDDDVVRHVAFYKPNANGLAERLLHQMAARPDLRRLTRIPLFLALLLATLKTPDDLPSRRTELIEIYLGLLFSPEQFKIGEVDSIDPIDVRTIVEEVAFEALERDEIGVSHRGLQLTIRRISASINVQAAIERLVRCGVLRRTVHQYLFPFPIVQEYLASCFMLQNGVSDVSARLTKAIKRPWAQTLQFVLEQHPSPSGLVSSLLSSTDDVFHTNLRLVARCISNGMEVDRSTWNAVATRLASAWANSTWRLSTRVGELIAEAFSEPLIEAVKEQLHKRNLLHSGAGRIIARAHDKELTKGVLTRLLAGDIEHLWHFHDLQEAVDELGDEALEIYVRHIPPGGAGAKEQSKNDAACTKTIAALIGHLDGTRISEGVRMAVALDEALPHQIRISAFCLGPQPLDARAESLVEGLLATSESIDEAMPAILRMRNSTERLLQLLSREDLTRDKRVSLMSLFVNSVDNKELSGLLSRIWNESSIDEELCLVAKVFAARYGDESAMSQLVDGFSSYPVDIVYATLSVFGFHRSDGLVQRAASALFGRALSPQDRVFLASGAVLGMTTKFEMSGFCSGALVPAPWHPGISFLRRLVDTWDGLHDYSLCESVKLGESSLILGADERTVGLGYRIVKLSESLDSSSENWEEGQTISSALRSLTERRQLLELSALEAIALSCNFNGAMAALFMIAAIGTRDAVDLLISLHGTFEDYHLQDEVVDMLEPLAGRFGLKVEFVDGRLRARPLDGVLAGE
ncbi:NACHT domain-containing protein [Burkholderia ambifaria]|uniref:NACHT domain-containing protein n=1 Tax=Burkholderia ambifaria TaxID=152480 RepID=UPI00158F00A8|nr:NACHT domain-containing protein [Burkholderia ambifaria]QQJ96403.1 NACHT domain-containing protein [Burkholderia ambifaria]